MSNSEGGEPLEFSQRGDLKAFAWLSLRNGLLNLITLTLYRFWGKTEVRRRLWATTYLNDEPFEYTGRGMELFLGFLFAMAVLVGPFLIIVFAAQFLGPVLSSVVILPCYLFLGFLVGFGRFTAFRYIATRTSWRGVRCNLEGSPAAFGWAFLGYGWLSGVTLGWFWPAAERRLAGKLWDGVRFGDRRLKFRIEDARKSPVYGAYALGWLLVLVSYIAFLAVVIAIVGPSAQSGVAPGLEQIAMIYAAVGVLGLVYAVAFAPFHAAMLRSIVAGVGLDDARFSLRIGWMDVAALSLTNVLLLVVSLGLLTPFIEARTRKILINRLESEGVVELNTIRQGAAIAPKTGEGLADAFGFAPV